MSIRRCWKYNTPQFDGGKSFISGCGTVDKPKGIDAWLVRTKAVGEDSFVLEGWATSLLEAKSLCNRLYSLAPMMMVEMDRLAEEADRG